MSTAQERIEKILKDKNINQSDLADIAETTPQNVTNWIIRNSISKKKAITIAKKLGYDVNWIVNGDSGNVTSTRLIAKNWDEMSNSEKDNGEFITVPVLDIELSAGHGALNDNEAETYVMPFRAYTLKKQGISCENVKVVRVSGDSMEPRLFDKDTIAIDMSDTRIRDGKIYAVRVGDIQKIKILITNSDGSVTLRSQNRNYGDELISKDKIISGDFQVLGRMWWHSSIDN